MTNPLLDIHRLPAFSRIKADHVEPAIDQILQENRQKLAELLKKSPDWPEFIHTLEKMDNRLSRAWSPVRHLNSVLNSDALRKAHDACVPKLSAYATELAQNPSLFGVYQQVKDSDQFASLDDASRTTIDNALLNFKLSGVALPDEQKQQFKDLKQQLSNLKTRFEHNVLDATQAWQMHIKKESDLKGIPEYARAMAKQEAKNEKEPGWIFTLDAPSYIAIMTYADNRAMRQEMYEAYTTRASDQGPDAGKFDNSDCMQQILSLRQQMAQLLGFNNYAELSIADKMAQSTDEVLKFLHDLVEKSRPQAKKEFNELVEFARQSSDIDELQAWDVAYFAEKLKQKEYGISQEELKPYFPADKVISGLFKIVQQLYAIEINRLEDIEVWHPDVTFYEIKDYQGQLRGQFYLDLYARANKRGGAWMDECTSRMELDSDVQIPVAYLTCNLTPPVGDDPALLSHDEVTTLFHEFGHGLHHLLTQVNALFVSGINGVQWDAVELPSQFMENWCWEREGLALIAGHYQTDQPLPEELFNKMLRAKNFQSAMFMVRQLEFALFDFTLHMEYDRPGFSGVQQLLDEIRQAVAVVMPPPFNRFQHSFTHIFSGGYAAGYYSYKWAEVLSADAFSLFEEKGILDQATGQSFLKNILEKGGSRKAMDLFTAFRGREPRIDALLRHSGLS